MARLLLAGFEPALAEWLAERLPDIGVQAVQTGSEAAHELAWGNWSLVVLHEAIGAPGLEGLLAKLRDELGQSHVPVFAAIGRGADQQLAKRLVGQFDVRQMLFLPLDREELLRQAAAVLKVVPARAEAPPAQSGMEAALAGLWERFKEATMKRVALIESANAALLEGRLADNLERQAEREAHKLMGSLGTFGFGEGSRLAGKIEALFQPDQARQADRGLRLSEALIALRRELDRSPLKRAAEPLAIEGAIRLLVVDDDAAVADALAREGRTRGLEVRLAANRETARQVISSDRPHAVVLDLALGGAADDGRGLLAELAASQPDLPVVVLTGRHALFERVETASLGAAAFLQKPMPAPQVLEAVDRVLRRRQAASFRVMAMDDDASVLEALVAILAPQGIHVTTCSDPFLFWQRLEEARPDLLMLDVDMPFVSGIELCRVVRNDPRWNELPVLFLTSRQDPATVQRVFSVGADDYLNKPIIPAELITRLTNRLERTKLLRELAETDPLTGVANRRKASQVIGYLTSLAERQRQPLALALLDLDHFKALNDTHGHPLGDRVLQRFGSLLQAHFRGADVIARWGGEEFLVALYGATRAEARTRLELLLERVRAEAFGPSADAPVRTSFSCGVAAFPGDGADLAALYVAADEALYRAKAAGRACVLEASSEREGVH